MIQHHRNDFYQRSQDYEEEDYEDYEEEASEYEEEEQEAPRPTKEEQDFLKLREQLKAQIRQKQNKQSSIRGRLSQSHKGEMVANGNFGSFFGPSKPSIAPRVIEESRSIREMKHLVTNYPNSSVVKRKDPIISSGSKSTVSHQNQQRPKIVNEVKNKAQTLKGMRDYSFLLSDDADFPDPANEPPKPKNTSAPAVDGRLAHASSKSKMPIGKPARPVPANHEVRKPSMSNQHVQNKVRQGKESIASRPRPSSDVSRKISSDVRTAHGAASGRPVGNVPLKNKVPNQSTVMNKPPRKISNEPNMKKNLSVSKTHSSVQKHYPEQRKQNHYPEQRKQDHYPEQRKQDHYPEQRKQNHYPEQRSQNHYPEQRSQNHYPEQRRQNHYLEQRSQNHYAEQRRLPPGTDRARTTMKQPMPSSRAEPSKQSTSRGLHNGQPIKKPIKRKPVDDDDDDDAGDFRSEIRKMFGYNPNKYAGMDEDDSDMEVGFDVIQKEERISSKIAKKEDEEQLRLIEEEEERERRMRMKKKQKLR